MSLRKLALLACLVFSLVLTFPRAILADKYQPNEAVRDPQAQDNLNTGTLGKSNTTKLSESKDLVGIIESIAKTLAIIVGGIWTYNKFIRERTGSPKAAVSHDATARVVHGDDIFLVNVSVNVSNLGSTLIPLRLLRTRIRRVLPLSEKIRSKISNGENFPDDRKTVLWPELDRRTWTWEEGEAEIEPSESQTKHCEFFIPSTVKTIQLYTFFRNSLKPDRDIGWTQRTILDLRKVEQEKAISETLPPPVETTEPSQRVQVRVDHQEPEDPN